MEGGRERRGRGREGGREEEGGEGGREMEGGRERRGRGREGGREEEGGEGGRGRLAGWLSAPENVFCSVRESRGWEMTFITPPLERVPQRIALSTRNVGGTGGGPVLAVVLGMLTW